MNTSGARTSRLPADRLRWVTVLTIAAGFCYLSWLTACTVTAREYPWDDSFISYIYSRNLAEGHGLRYNSDDPDPTEGFSSLAHVLAVALDYRLGIDPLVATRGLGLGCFLLIPVSVGWSLATLLKTPRPDALAIACAAQFLYFLSYATPYHLNLGMETVLFMGSVACLAAWSLGELATGKSDGKPFFRRILFGCAAVTLVALGRPEGPLLVLLTLVVVSVAGSQRLGAPGAGLDRAFFVVAGWAVIGLAAYLAWRVWYFGYLLPNPYYVKSHNAIMGTRAAFFPGWHDTRGFLGLVAPWVAVAIPLLLLARGGRNEKKALLAASVPGILMVLLYVRVIHEAAFHYRYEFPFLVYLNLLLGGAAGLVCRRLRLAAPVLLAVIAVGISFAELPVAILKMKPSALLRVRAENSSSTLVAMGKDLGRTRLGRQATIALSAAGAIPYFSGFRAIDVVGLNDPYLSGREPRTSEEVWRYIDRSRPDVIQSGLPPATQGIGLDRHDPVMDSPVVSGYLRGSAGSELAKYYERGKLIELMRREMIYLRDHCTFGGAYFTGKSWTILYLRRDSPHLQKIRESLLSTSFAIDRDTDLAASFTNDRRRL